MGQYLTTDSTGKYYAFTIKGETPSPIEMSRIQSHLTTGAREGPQAATVEPVELSVGQSMLNHLKRAGMGIQGGTADLVALGMSKYDPDNPELMKQVDDLREYATKKREDASETPVRDKSFFEAEGPSAKLESLAGTLIESAPPIVAGVGTALLTKNPVLATAAGSAFGIPMAMESNVQRQIDEYGEVKDWDKAGYGAIGQGLIESVSDLPLGKIAGLFGKAGDSVVKDIANKAIKKAWVQGFKQTGKGIGVGAISNFFEEGSQQMIERWQADLPLLNDQAKKEYLENAIVGSILGVGLGAVGGVAGGVDAYKATHAKNEAIKAGGGAGKDATTNAFKDAIDDANADAAAMRAERTPISPPTYEPLGTPKLAEAIKEDHSAPAAEAAADPKDSEKRLPPGLRQEAVVSSVPVPDATTIAAATPVPTIDRGDIPTPEGLRAASKIEAAPLAEPLTAPSVPVKPHEAKKRLRDLGYAPDDIKKMTSSQVYDIVNAKQAAAAPLPTPAAVTAATKPGLPFTEFDYKKYVESLRTSAKGNLSEGKVAKALGINTVSARTLIDEMVKRQDARPSGAWGKYAKMIEPKAGAASDATAREFSIKPVIPTNHAPFFAEMNGKRRSPDNFKTEADALAWVEKNVPKNQQKSVLVATDPSAMQHGVYETVTEGGKVVNENLVSTHATEGDAKKVLGDLDPAYSTITNERSTQTAETKKAEVARDVAATLGPYNILQSLTDRMVGRDRVGVDVTDRIDDAYMASKGKSPGTSINSAIVEGVNFKQTIGPTKDAMRQVIALASTFADTNMSQDEKTKRLAAVLNHEIIHAIRNLNLLSPQEWGALVKAAMEQKVPGKNYTWAMRAEARNPRLRKEGKVGTLLEEGVAEMFRAYIDRPDLFKGPERTALAKIADFIRKLVGLGRKHDAQQIMDAIFGGEVGQRQVDYGGTTARNADDVWFSLLRPDNFYLKSERFLEGVTTLEAKKNDWIKMLSNPDTGIKREELNWLNLINWLQDQPKDQPIHKLDIINYIRASGPKISVTVKSRTTHPQFGPVSVDAPSWESRTQAVGVMGPENYFEAIFTFAPIKGEPEFAGGVHATVLGSNIKEKKGFYGNDTRIAVPNVLAFARLRDVWKGAGKFLFVEEIQSDLHQKGSMNGYYSKTHAEKTKALRVRYDEIQARINNIKQHRTTLHMDIMGLNNKLDKNLVDHHLSAEEEALYRQSAQASRKQFDDLNAQLEVANKEEVDVREASQRANQAQNIPNAPFKTNWEDYVIRRLIRHAAEHGYDGIVWHGSPASVADTEQYGELTEVPNDKGKTQYIAGASPTSAGVSVTPIVNRYMLRFPKTTREIGGSFGVDLEHQTVASSQMRDDEGKPLATRGGYVPADVSDNALQERWPDKQAMLSELEIFHAVISGMQWHSSQDSMEAGGIMRLFDKMAQIGRQMRQFDAAEVVHLAKAKTDHLLQIIRTVDTSSYYGAKASEDVGVDGNNPFAHDYYMLRLNNEMKEGFERGDQPYFSMLEEQDREPKYSAAAPLGTRVGPAPPPDRLEQALTKATHNNLAPVFQKFFRTVGANTVANKLGVSLETGVEGSLIQLQDRMLSLGKLVDTVRKNDGIINTGSDPYVQQALMVGQVEERIAEMDRLYYTPMGKAIHDLPVTLHDASELKNLNEAAGLLMDDSPDHRLGMATVYRYAQHALERNAEMARRNEKFRMGTEQQQSGSGMSDFEAQQILDWFNRKPFGAKFNSETDPNSIRMRARALVEATKDVRIDGGVMPDVRSMNYTEGPRAGQPVDHYKDYAPLRGFLQDHPNSIHDDNIFGHTGLGFNIRGKENPSAAGRGSTDIDGTHYRSLGANLFANDILQNQEAIVRAAKNKVDYAFYKMIQENPDQMKFVATVLPVPPSKWAYNATTGNVQLMPDPAAINGPDILKFKIKGQQMYIRIHDPRIAKAMGAMPNLGGDGLGQYMLRGMRAFNRFLATMVTSLNLEFMVSNFERDMTTALVNLSEHEAPGLKAKVLKSLPFVYRGIRNATRKGDRTSPMAQAYWEFRQHGGATSIQGLVNLEDSITRVNKELALDHGGNMGKMRQVFEGTKGFIEDWNLAVENTTRVAVYMGLRDHYLSLTNDPTDPANIKRAQEQAAFAAKRKTVDFNMGGEMKPVFDALWMFYGASFSGSMAMINPLIRSRRMKQVWSGIVVAGMVQEMLNSVMSPEDDDGEKIYDKIPDYILEHNWIIIDPFGISQRGYIKIPMPYGFNGVFNLGRSAIRAVRGKYTPGEAINSGLGTLANSFNPLGEANNIINWMAPTVLDPIVDLWNNEDYTGAPIAPAASPYGPDEIASQRYWNNTSPVNITIANMISRLTGSQGDMIPGYVEISPNQIGYVLETLTGGLGAMAGRAYNLVAPEAMLGKGTLIKAAQGDFQDFDVNSIPFVRKFAGNVTSKNDLQSYIKDRDRILTIRAGIKDALKEGNRDLAKSIKEKYAKEIALAGRVNAIENARKKLSARIKKIRERDSIPQARKDELIKAAKEKQDHIVGVGNRIMQQGMM